MKESRRYFVDVIIRDLSIPIKIGLKNKAEGESTIATITIQAKIEKKTERRFEKQVMEIVNDKRYIGPKQLGSALMNYINTLNAKAVNISFWYPFFYKNNLKGTKNSTLMKYKCEYILRKTSLINYKQKYKVELPIIAEQYIIPGIQKEIMDVPAKIVVEVEGFETIFIEDIIETINKNLIKREYYTLKESIQDIITLQNTGLTLLENIESDLYRENDIEWCSVKLINRRIPYTYSLKVSGEDRVIEHEKKYADVHLFI
jgi:hypothetical protein